MVDAVQLPPGSAGEGGTSEAWRKTARSLKLLSVIVAVVAAPLNMALMLSVGIGVALVGTVGYLFLGFLAIRELRSARMRKLGLSAERAKEIEGRRS
jgi:Flp pilus assembly protein TadB